MIVPETEIVVTKDGAEILRMVVRPGDYVIGCEPGCEVHLDVELVSRRHAQLTVNFDHALIEDLGSSNGTQVNGKSVTEITRLWPNQKIQIGTATLELRRLKTVSSPDVSLAPATAALREVLPEEFLHGKKYDIGGVIAQGGMGAILDVREAATERKVAMKVMLDGSSPDDLVRFVAEAKVTAQLEHPNIVPVHELSIDENGQPFYTMKMVRGINLRKVLELMAAGTEATVRKYPLGNLLTIFQKVCDAVAFAHSKGVIHRDLKPDNIMLGDFGEVLVMDWGLAKVLGGRDGSPSRPGALGESALPTLLRSRPMGSATMTGSIMGTPQYMAPEQARGEVETLDARADIYSLGAILYHLLALRPSVEGHDAMAIVDKVARGEVEPLVGTPRRGVQGERGEAAGAKRGRRGAPSLPHLPGGRAPDSLAAVVCKAMALDAAQRYACVADLQADVTAFQNGFATGAEKAGRWKQFTLLMKRNKAASIGVAAVLVLSLGFTAKVITEGRRAENALADLRSAAPTLISQARGLIDEQKFDDALVKIDFAVKIDGRNADYRLLRAQVLEATLRLQEAAVEFRHVLSLGPNDSAATNLALCEKLLRDNQGNADIDEPGLKALHELMLKEQRTTQDVPIATRLGLGRAATDARFKALFEAWRKLPGWETYAEKERFTYQTDGTVFLHLGHLPISDLSVLKGLPISKLNIGSTKVEDLSPLTGLRLVAFQASHTHISDLSQLRGTPLNTIDLSYCPNVADLSPLAGMPLEHCDLTGVQATDFSPLKHCPIKWLNISETRITTLDAFAGMPCDHLVAKNIRALTDISAVRTMRLTYADFGDSTGIDDLAPLAECPDMESLSVPREAKNVASLRRLTKLRSIIYGGGEHYSPEELWVKLGIADDRDREHIALIQKARAAMIACGLPKPDPTSIKILPDGTMDLRMFDPECQTLAPLRGLPVSMLNIGTSGVTDLSPLADMPLSSLVIDRTRIADLSPLAICRKLEFLRCDSTAVRDLAPLAGLPLVYLNAGGNNFSSIAPLAGMPLQELRIDRTSVSDVRPLLACPTLEWLTLPSGARDVGQLRALKKLTRVSERFDANVEGSSYYHGGGPAQTAEEFWKEYDAQQKAAPPR